VAVWTELDDMHGVAEFDFSTDDTFKIVKEEKLRSFKEGNQVRATSRHVNYGNVRNQQEVGLRREYAAYLR
jgi:hypothetical protein